MTSTDSQMLPAHLVRVKESEWPYTPTGLFEVWRSRAYLVQLYTTDYDGLIRMTANRPHMDINSASWADQIPWDDLQRLKRECGRGECDAIECFPRDYDIVNVANMRHLWIFENPDWMPFKVPPVFWRRDE